MPRKLLRVALVAAILPALAPETSSAQTVKAGSTVRVAAAPAQATKKGIGGWIERMRGDKSASAKIKKVKFEGDNPFEESSVKPGTPFDLEGNEDVRLLKSNTLPRPRPAHMQPQGQPGLVRPQPTAAQPVVEQVREVATPVEAAVSAAVPELRNENPFLDDAPTQQRGQRTAAAVAAPVAEEEFPDPPVRRGRPSEELLSEELPSTERATPVDGTDEGPEALPIETAAPPADVNAGYRSEEGTTPRYRRTNMTSQDTPAVDVPAPAAPVMTDDEEVTTPRTQPRTQPQPIGKSTGTRGRPVVVNAQPMPVPVYPQSGIPGPVYGGPAGYARLDAALYPSPRQDIPGYVGSTMITNPALDPHEMLYAHSYRGLYGPFYYKTYRSWVMTPFGICKNEKRVLVGTEVRVNYRSSISPFALFFPPISR